MPTSTAGRLRAARAALGYGVVVLAVAAASIAVGLQVTPLQTVSALGETVDVGAASPTLSVSGPGELDLFGQRIHTVVHFDGPVRPRLVLSGITVNRQVASFLQPSTHDQSARALGRALADGWTRYFAWQVVIVGASALVLLGAIAGWRRLSWRRSVLLVVVGLVVVEAVDLGGVMVTAYSAPRLLAKVGSIDDLVGRSSLGPPVEPVGPEVHGVQAVVIGDSTAAGDGLPPVQDPSPLDTACQRSRDSYAAALGLVNDWHVLNLACSSATIPNGLLGPQLAGGQVVPPQVGRVRRVSGKPVVIVSIGADDMQWSAMFQLCAVIESCDNQASTAFFQGKLAAFTQDYYGLLRQVADLPGKRLVIVNSYYQPFSLRHDCLADKGLTRRKIQVLVSEVHALNAVLAKGARVSGFASVQPNFAGHQICTAHPYVQGLDDAAPFHPTLAGSLAIALADEQAIAAHGH